VQLFVHSLFLLFSFSLIKVKLSAAAGTAALIAGLQPVGRRRFFLPLFDPLGSVVV